MGMVIIAQMMYIHRQPARPCTPSRRLDAPDCMKLWLKSLGRYSEARVNALGAIPPSVGIFFSLLICFASDLWLGPAWAITVSHTWNIMGLIILTIWDVPEPALWFAYSTIYASCAMSGVFHGWVNTQLRASPAERAFTLVLINVICASSMTWIPLLVLPTVEAPRFPKAFPFAMGCAVLLIVATHGLRLYIRRREYVFPPVGLTCLCVCVGSLLMIIIARVLRIRLGCCPRRKLGP